MLQKQFNNLVRAFFDAPIAFALANISGSAAYAGPAVPLGHYCMAFDTDGSDCGFTSYEQCLATREALTRNVTARPLATVMIEIDGVAAMLGRCRVDTGIS